MSTNLSFKAILSNGIAMGLKNLVPLIIAIFLWSITIIIPVINVGTTIAILTLPAELSRGKVINPLFIFESKYRKYMGEFFLASAFVSMIVVTGFCFMIIPGIIMAYTFAFTTLLVIDKGISPTEALSKSNQMTYGYKLQMFLANLIFSILLLVALVILAKIHVILSVILLLAASPISISMTAYIYGELLKIDEEREIEKNVTINIINVQEGECGCLSDE